MKSNGNKKLKTLTLVEKEKKKKKKGRAVGVGDGQIVTHATGKPGPKVIFFFFCIISELNYSNRCKATKP